MAGLQLAGERSLRSTRDTRVFVQEAPGACPCCGGKMCVQKTSWRKGVTREHGSFSACETIHVCAAGCRTGDKLVTRRASALASVLPPKGVVGYDVIVFVGLERYVRHRQREEIRAQLALQGIHISDGEISGLCRRFLAYLEALHESCAAGLRDALAKDGGWPLHVDATGEDGRGTLLVVLAGWRRWVLGAWKIPTERADAIIPRLRAIVERFGAPCALVRDLGRAVTEACNTLVASLEPTPPVLACHLHFLADVGGDLLEQSHGQLRELFRRFGVKAGLRALARDLGRALGTHIAKAREAFSDWQGRAGEGHLLPEGNAGLAIVRAMAQWVLDHHCDGQDQGFPFDLPYLALRDRCVTARRAADAFARRLPDDKGVTKALERLRRILEPTVSEVPFERTCRVLRARDALFTELRDALRLRPKPAGRRTSSLTTPLMQADELRDIQAAITQLTASLAQRRPARGPAQDMRQAIDIVLTHLKTHGRYLFGHVVQLSASAGGATRIVDRTNNRLETFFDELKRGERRRSGRKNLAQDLEQMPPAATLASNLCSPEYVAIVCGSLEKLPQAFAALDAKSSSRSSLVARAATRTLTGTDCDVVSASLPTPDRILIRTEAMEARLHAAANSRAPR